MELEEMVWKRSVREGYTVLLKAEAKLLLPKDCAEMRDFYQRLADACMNWTIDVYGERLRTQFLSLSDVREKSRFRTQQYRFWMRIPWQDAEYLTMLCESERTTPEGGCDFYRVAHTWKLAEQTALPTEQVMRLFGARIGKRELPFSADGIYREGDKLVIFQNKTEKNGFREAKLPLEKP